MSYEEKEIYARGRYDSNICIEVVIYPKAIVAMAASEHLTQYQMKRALAREFPGYTFSIQEDNWFMRADAKRR